MLKPGIDAKETNHDGIAEAYRGYKGLVKKFRGTKIETEANRQISAIEKDRLMNYRSNCPACKKEGKTCTQHRG